MNENYIIIAVSVLGTAVATLLVKVLFDWLQKAGRDEIYREMYGEISKQISQIRNDFDTRFDTVISGLADLNTNLSKNYATHDSCKRIWKRIEKHQARIVRLEHRAGIEQNIDGGDE